MEREYVCGVNVVMVLWWWCAAYIEYIVTRSWITDYYYYKICI